MRENRTSGLRWRGLETERKPPRQSPTLLEPIPVTLPLPRGPKGRVFARQEAELTAMSLVLHLEPIEAAAASAPDTMPLSTDDQAALLAIAGGAKLYEHLLTGRTTAGG
jgi:hypothetical protein